MTNFLTVLDVIGLVLLSLYLFQMLLAATLPRPRRDHEPDNSLRFTALIPALNEQNVIGITVRSLRTVAPEARVAVIDDGSEDATSSIVQALADSDPHVTLLRRARPQAREGKGKALNWAVRQLIAERQAEGLDLQHEVFVILDADGRLTPGLLPEARQAFADPQVMGAQAQTRIRMSDPPKSLRGWAGRMLELEQDIEFFIVRHMQQMRSRWHSVILFGNGQFMRASYLAGQFEQGHEPWPDCLSEDLASALEMRLANTRSRMAFLQNAVTQQGLPNIQGFSRQRARWTQGTMQCAPYIARLWRSPVRGIARLDLTYFLISPWFNAIVVTSLLSQPVRLLLGERGLILDPVVVTFLTVVNVAFQINWVARYAYHNRLSPGRVAFAFAGLPVYGFALFLSLPMAYKHHFTGRHTWDKSTRHAEPEGAAGPSGVAASGD